MNKIRVLLILAALGTVASAQSGVPITPRKAKPPNARLSQVLAVDEARRRAMLEGDVAALDRILANDVTIFWGDGTEDNKISTLELFRSRRLRYDQLEYFNTRVRLFGETAVLTGEARIKAAGDGHTISYLVRSTRVYVNQNVRWVLVANQTTRVRSLP